MLSVGEILKRERHNKGLLLKDVEKQIKVREIYLKAIEENRWESFSSKIYITGILNNYSRLLGLDEKKISAFFRRDYEKKEEVKFKKKVTSSYLISGTKKLMRIILLLSFLAIFGYFLYQLSLYFSPPKFILISPKTTNFTTEDKIEVVGKTDKDAIVTAFGQRIYLKSDGTFQYDFPLHEGKNNLVFKLTGANGKNSQFSEVFTKTSPK